jgi:hypothetical protein
MPIIITIAILVIAASGLGTAGFLHINRVNKRQYAEWLAKIAALPLPARLDELLKARSERASARVHLASVRKQFNLRWGYRTNPYFSALLFAQSAYAGARDRVRQIEALCKEPSDSAE